MTMMMIQAGDWDRKVGRDLKRRLTRRAERKWQMSLRLTQETSRKKWRGTAQDFVKNILKRCSRFLVRKFLNRNIIGKKTSLSLRLTQETSGKNWSVETLSDVNVESNQVIQFLSYISRLTNRFCSILFLLVSSSPTNLFLHNVLMEPGYLTSSDVLRTRVSRTLPLLIHFLHQPSNPPPFYSPDQVIKCR